MGDTFTYQKTGSILSVVGNDVNIVHQIEWFDTEIDAILMQNRMTKERKFLNEIIFPKKNTPKFGDEKIHDTAPLNTEIINSLPEILPHIDFYLI